MELGITIPLQHYLKLNSPPYGIESNLQLCWELHVLKPSGEPSLLAVHASSRYTFLLHNPALSEWKDLASLFLDGLRVGLASEGYSQEQINGYLALAGEPVLTKTHGRRPVAFLNRAVDDLYGLPVGLDASTSHQPQVTLFLNEIICHAAGHTGYGTAREFLRRDMSMLGI